MAKSEGRNARVAVCRTAEAARFRLERHGAWLEHKWAGGPMRGRWNAAATGVKARSNIPRNFVIPAQAGIQNRYAGDPAAISARLDPRLRGDDANGVILLTDEWRR